MERRRVIEKFINVVCMESQRAEEPVQAQQVDNENSITSNEHTSTTTSDVYEEEESSEAEVQQALYDYQCFEDDIQEAMQEEADKHNDSDRDCGTDTEMPVLVGWRRHDASSNDDTSNESYEYHTDNNNSSIDNSDDESNNTIPGLQERNRDDSSSDGDSAHNQDHEGNHPPVAKHQSVPQSIDTKPIVYEWTDDNIDGDEYDGDHDDNDMSTRAKRVLIVPLRLQGGNGIPVVKTVTEEDTNKWADNPLHITPRFGVICNRPKWPRWH